MKALIIGAAGFVGNYLISQLIQSGWNVIATKMHNETIDYNGIDIYDLDILDKEAVLTLLEKTSPDYIFHLAAQSSVALSWKNPQLTIDVNIKGSVNVLESIRLLPYNPRVLLIGSGEEYGTIKQSEIPIKEDTSLRPGNIYAATKTCQNMIGKIYADSYDLQIMMVRAFNHIGPKQSPMFVVSDFCKQVAEIEKGIREPIIHVGNLSVKRDFTDVRDVVRAYHLLIQKGEKGESYNVGSGKAIEIDIILQKILSLSTYKISVLTDDLKVRPSDTPIVEASITKLQNCTGWYASIPLDQTLSDTLEFWRSIV
jgi:GDP-4-dehydro-6-deoxy-D-mannose reductase